MSRRTPHRAAFVAATALVLGVAGAVAASGQGALTAARVPPFSAAVTNPWFPLAPGSRYVYTGTKDGEPSRDVVTVLRRTKTVAGAPCVIVDDRLYLRGRLAERTADWYSQDTAGNVWYFGEDTAELDRQGRVRTREGSWTAGVDGARPGIFIPARPRLHQSARQEYYKGHAEDHFEVIGLFGRGAGLHPTNALLVKEWTPLEPGTIDHKLYVRGVGLVLEQTERGGDERNELVSFRQS